MKWMHWLVVGGLAVDLIDAFTAKAGAGGGIFYGPTGFLFALDGKLPGGLHPGEAVAMIGVALTLGKK